MDDIISVKLVRSKRKAPTTSQITTNDILSKPKTKKSHNTLRNTRSVTNSTRPIIHRCRNTRRTYRKSV